MCDPVSIGVATAALSAASSVTEYIGTKNAYKANEDAANLTYANERTILGQKATQLDQERSLTAEDTAIATLQSEGRIAASAAEQGLGTSSIAQKLNADMFGLGRQVSAADINDRNARSQLANEGTGLDITRQSTINSKPKASKVGLALSIGSSALKGANAYGTAGGR